MAKRTRVLILGAGFIGKNLIKSLLLLNYDIFVIDSKECPSEFMGRVNWIRGSIENESVLNEGLTKEIDCVYHLASSTVPSDGMEKGLMSMHAELKALVKIIEICVEQKVAKFVFASSASVYGRQDLFPIKETALANPISAHGILKLTMEKYLFLFRHLHKIDIVCVRISNPYGPGQNILGRQGFVAMLIGHILNNTPVVLRNNGKAIRDFVYIDDLVIGLASLVKANNVPWLINLGTGESCTLKEIVILVEQILGRQINKIIDQTHISEDIPESVLDISLAKKSLEYMPMTSIELGIKNTFKFHGLI